MAKKLPDNQTEFHDDDFAVIAGHGMVPPPAHQASDGWFLTSGKKPLAHGDIPYDTIVTARGTIIHNTPAVFSLTTLADEKAAAPRDWAHAADEAASAYARRVAKKIGKLFQHAKRIADDVRHGDISFANMRKAAVKRVRSFAKRFGSSNPAPR